MRHVLIEKGSYTELPGEQRQEIADTFYILYKLCADYGGVCPAQCCAPSRIRYMVFGQMLAARIPEDWEARVVVCLDWLERQGFISRGGGEVRVLRELLPRAQRTDRLRVLRCAPLQLPDEPGGVLDTMIAEETLVSAAEVKAPASAGTKPFGDNLCPEFPNRVHANTKCPRCGEHVVLQWGKMGYFFSCKCQGIDGGESNTKTHRFLHDVILAHGLSIYRLLQPCPHCAQSVPLLSYFPQVEYTRYEPDLSAVIDYSDVFLSSFPALDAQVHTRFRDAADLVPVPEGRRGNRRIPLRWMTRCPSCERFLPGESFQAAQRMLTSAVRDGLVEDFIVGELDVNGDTLPYSEWVQVSRYANGFLRKTQCSRLGKKDSEISWDYLKNEPHV